MVSIALAYAIRRTRIFRANLRRSYCGERREENYFGLRNSSGSLAIFAAMRRALRKYRPQPRRGVGGWGTEIGAGPSKGREPNPIL